MATESGTTLNLREEIRKVEKERIPAPEYTLSKGLMQPFRNTNSGSRCIMEAIQMEQCQSITHPEMPIISTGYENQFAEYNSNFVKADHNYVVIDKISKFSSKPNEHYWLILLDVDDNILTCVERVGYKHITEFYGYLYDNEYLDSLDPGAGIDKGTVMQKTLSYDEYNNRAYGLNLSTMYIACEDVKEDPIVISESAAKRFEAPMIDKVEVRINDNDILLNLYGQGNEYKTFPDIGEDVKGNLLCAVRRELKDEEALFSQSWNRLKEIMMNDKKYTVEGKVVDIDVYCNNPDKVNSVMYNAQIKKYYEESQLFARKFVDAVDAFTKDKGPIEMSYILKKEYARCLDIVNGVQFIQDKVFNNITMFIYVQQIKPLKRGDKITDRYGGKGVISRVRPDNEMPHYLRIGKSGNPEWVPVDVLYSKFTCINRLNDGQLFETSITYQGKQLIEAIRQGMAQNKVTYDLAWKWICSYVRAYAPDQADEMEHMFGPMEWTSEGSIQDKNEEILLNRNLYIEQMLHEGFIMLCMEPISSYISIDKVAAVYNMFPFIKKHTPVCAPQQDSNGNYRMVYTRRPCVIGYKYIFRLKQFAVEKFSVVSLASTNIRNENSKSRLAKTHNAKFASTPVRIYGEMESSTIGAHIGTDIFYEAFMLTSSSPEGRRSHEKLLTGDPFDFNIELDENCTSLNADIGQAYLKTLGERLRFIKIKKFRKRPMIKAVMIERPRKMKNVMYQVEPGLSKKEREKLRKKLIKEDAAIEKKPTKDVMEFIPGVREEYLRYEEYKKKLHKLGLD